MFRPDPTNLFQRLRVQRGTSVGLGVHLRNRAGKMLELDKTRNEFKTGPARSDRESTRKVTRNHSALRRRKTDNCKALGHLPSKSKSGKRKPLWTKLRAMTTT